mgnify:CR=1 FL=1
MIINQLRHTFLTRKILAISWFLLIVALSSQTALAQG